MTSIKVVAQSSALNSLPSSYAYSANRQVAAASDPDGSLPVIDFSLLTSGNPDQRAKVVHDLGKACEEWGFFLLTSYYGVTIRVSMLNFVQVVNHGMPETLVEKVFNASHEFFNLTEEEKKEFEGKHALDPIRCGTSFHNANKGKVLLWRDYLKVFSHPEFHFPNKPAGFSELAFEYSERTRKVARELLKGISESLGLEESYMDEALDLDSGVQVFAVNLYPPCPQPDLAIGVPPHTDHGLVTLMQNGVGGLQVQHKGKWLNVNALPNSIMVNTGDHLEIFSNGKYKSVMHRAVLNNSVTRITLVTPNGPSFDITVSPASKLVDNKSNPPAYKSMKYKEYLELQQNTPLDGIPCLDRVKVQEE
ncbi:hypothetical protein RJ639_033701 [Escallonia herrerae]|uniref:Fe2OG dioxygenase domain-containing protein n=1 Tax=Escallonia herrerae TaxID=1293975 RepID=A0AA88WVG5_9ASTE|nr:hypothetical protein RJ639_033701 [Escallonia herrerae]